METLDTLLAPISPESPCGVDITWEPSLAEIRTAIRGKIDRKIEETSGGKRMVEVIEEPNWPKVLSLCEASLRRSKHLEVGVIYATARLQLHGLEGMAEGISLISGLVQQYWEPLYPALDAHDNLDPTQRFGLIENLSLAGASPEDDPLRFVERLRQVPFCRRPQLGIINLLSLQNAKPASDAPAAQLVREAMAEAFQTSPAEMKEGAEAVEVALDSLRAMNQFFTETKAMKEAPEMDRLERQLNLIREVYQSGESPGTAQPQAVPSALSVTEVQPVPGKIAEPVVVVTGEIRSSADVLRCLDRICEYYKRAEPSSPVPLILARARRLVDQSFMDVLTDLAASAVDQVKVITGDK